MHGYARQSVDLDFATYENPFERLGELALLLREQGYSAELTTPDAEDPLGGVINITGEDFDPVQIVNFLNPLNQQRIHTLVGEALAELPVESGRTQVVSAELLVVLKLYAGDSQSLNDIQRLIQANPDIDRKRVTELAERAGLSAALKEMLR